LLSHVFSLLSFLRRSHSEAKNELVAAVIGELGLVNAQDTVIGNAQIRGVSGGERKRANIGEHIFLLPMSMPNSMSMSVACV
jgi:ABC-type multidrug transport system ATPase subunit